MKCSVLSPAEVWYLPMTVEIIVVALTQGIAQMLMNASKIIVTAE